MNVSVLVLQSMWSECSKNMKLHKLAAKSVFGITKWICALFLYWLKEETKEENFVDYHIWLKTKMHVVNRIQWNYFSNSKLCHLIYYLVLFSSSHIAIWLIVYFEFLSLFIWLNEKLLVKFEPNVSCAFFESIKPLKLQENHANVAWNTFIKPKD